MPLPRSQRLCGSNLDGYAYCHGRLVRCGETKTQLPRSKLKRLWEMSFKTGSVMVARILPVQKAGWAEAVLGACIDIHEYI